jgi:arabinogalactan oligomer/maltooligosaccharide transport system permease protein
LISAVALAATLLCAAPQPVMVWHAYRGAEEQALTQLVDQFNDAHPEYRAQLLAIPYDAYPSKLTSAMPTGHGPDLFIFAQERIGGWAREGFLSPLDTELESLAGEFPESATEALTFEGHTYGLPLGLKSVALYVNRKLVPQPPATTDALVRIAVANTDLSQQRYGLAYPVSDFYFHAAWLTGFGGSIFKEPGHQIVLDTPEATAALAFVRDLALEKRVIPEEPSATLVTALFNEGKAAMVISGPWLAGELHDVDYAVAPLPVVSATGLPMRPLLTVEAAMISRFATAPEGARALARFLVSKDAAIVRATVGHQVVATRSAYSDPRVGQDPVLAAFSKQAEVALPMDNTPAMGAVWEPQKRALSSVLAGGLTPEAALAQAQRRVLATTRAAPPTQSPWPYLLGLLGVAVGTVIVLRRRAPPPRSTLAAVFDVGSKAYAYVLPAALGLGVLVFIPFGAGMGLSLFHHHEGHFTFVGLHNFVDILTSHDYRLTEPMNFYFTLGVTLLWTVSNVAAHVGIGLVLALVLREPLLKLKGLYRVLLIVPWAIPNYITALIWKGMFHRQFGAISALLAALHLQPISWFTHFSTAFAANLVTNTWLGFPFMMVVTLGALQSIPTDLYEAAEVDGASKWAQFRHITLPLLRPALLPAIILGSVWTFNMFNIIYLVSGGDPGGSTDILVSEAYRWAFQRNEQFGFAAAYSTLIFLFLLGYSAVTRRVGKDPALEAA